jgi:photosystem I subunit 8
MYTILRVYQLQILLHLVQHFLIFLLGAFDMTGDYAASYLPWILIPIVCWLMPAVVMGLLFIYIESES